MSSVEAYWATLPTLSYYGDIQNDVAKASQELAGSPRQMSQLAEYHERRSQPSIETSDDKALRNEIYTPLSSYDDKEIRTLELLPGSFDDPLEGTLHHCSLGFEYPDIVARLDGDAGALTSSTTFSRHTRHALSSDGRALFYTALSYTWGAPVFDCSLGCNGAVKHITRTLDSALRHLRRSDEAIMLWVDQVCINQEDNADKERQIPLMSLIYRRALNTMIWLGEDNDSLAFVVLESIQRNLGEYAFDEQPSAVFERYMSPDGAMGFSIQQAWDALQGLFSRWWFSRTWIIQEAVLSQLAIVCCGSKRVPFEDLATSASTAVDSGFYRWLSRQVEADVSSIALGCRIASELGKQRNNITHMTRMGISFAVALEDCRYAACADPRDKVYGVLGMCNVDLRPEYQKPVADVYWEATLAAIHEHPRDKGHQGSVTSHYHAWFRVLSCVDHPPEGDRPSWVPNWSKPRQTSALGFSSSCLVAYNAGSWDCEDVFPFEEQDRVLRLTGRLLGTVTKLTETVVAPSLSDSGNMVWLEKLRDFVGECCPYVTGEELEGILMQCCVAGKNETGKLKSPQEFREQFGRLLRRSAAHASKYSNTHRKSSKPPREKRAGAYENLQLACDKSLANRRLCALSSTHVGLVPRYAEQGDVVAVFAGAGLPFVIRHLHDDDYLLIGECYIHGVMQGEIQDLGVDDCTIRLV